MEYLNKIKKTIEEFDTIYIGCTNSQIDEIEKKINAKLPVCYTEFLSFCGISMDRKNVNSRGGFVGESIFYGDVLGDFTNKDALIEQLEEDGRSDLQITNNDFVFFCSQGYIFAFFKLNEGDNPPVYGYMEGYKGNSFPKLTDTLVEFYEKYLEFGQSPFTNLRK